jgi:hypothetical protein
MIFTIEFLILNWRYMLSCSKNAPVAQLDRASDYGSEGLGFESLRVYEFLSFEEVSVLFQ